MDNSTILQKICISTFGRILKINRLSIQRTNNNDLEDTIWSDTSCHSTMTLDYISCSSDSPTTRATTPDDPNHLPYHLLVTWGHYPTDYLTPTTENAAIHKTHINYLCKTGGIGNCISDYYMSLMMTSLLGY